MIQKLRLRQKLNDDGCINRIYKNLGKHSCTALSALCT